MDWFFATNCLIVYYKVKHLWYLYNNFSDFIRFMRLFDLINMIRYERKSLLNTTLFARLFKRGLVLLMNLFVSLWIIARARLTLRGSVKQNIPLSSTRETVTKKQDRQDYDQSCRQFPWTKSSTTVFQTIGDHDFNIWWHSLVIGWKELISKM